MICAFSGCGLRFFHDDVTDQVVERGIQCGFEVSFHFVHVCELGEGPAAVGAQSVDARYPVGVHGGFFVFGVFSAITLDFDDQVQGVVAASVVHQQG